MNDIIGKEADKEKKMAKRGGCDDSDNYKDTTKSLTEMVSELYSKLSTIQLETKYIPNMQQHQIIWVSHNKNGILIENAFVSNIDEETINLS